MSLSKSEKVPLMFALRCTKKLLDCIPGALSEPGPSDTVLGDWYANLHESNPPVILLMSERTLLPIVIEANPIDGIVVNFIEQLAFVLHHLGVDRAHIMRELHLMTQCEIGKTVNRRATRLMSDSMYHLGHALYDRKLKSLAQVSSYLDTFPLKALEFRKAGEVTRDLFNLASKPT